MNVTIERNDRVRMIARVLAAMAIACTPLWAHAAGDAGDGWQMLSASGPRTDTALPSTTPAAVPGVAPSLTVTPVVLPATSSATAGVLTFSVSPQDLNLRNAMDRWLQTQGWQLAWKVDDDLPLEFNATFTGDLTSVLTQVMKATNHMRVPTRVCRHTNNVIRVVARAANCQE